MRAIFMTLTVAPLLALHAQGARIEHASWLTGCWELTNGPRRVIERWSTPSAGIMTGASRTTVNNVPRESEKLRLFVASDTLVYEAMPSGQTLTLFKAKMVSDRALVFENLAHDFPQRIVYERAGQDSVIARIEGDRAGRRQPVSFPFRRVECTADTPTPVELARVALEPLYRDFSDKETSDYAGTNAWFVQHAGDGFQFVAWVVPGSTPVVASKEQLTRSIDLQRNSPAIQALRDRTTSFTLDRLNVRGDTITALLSIQRVYRFPDTPGRYGPAGDYHERRSEQRRLDTWIRIAGTLRLREAEIISEDVKVDGKLTSRDGTPVPQVPPS